MPYQIQPGEQLTTAIPRILREESDFLIHCLTEEPDVHRAVHEARKACKRIRAVWRLIRDTIGKKSYRLENATYRDASRRLSDLRDLSALIDALNGMNHEEMSDEIRTVWDRARQDLLTLRHQSEARMSRAGLEEVAQEIRIAQRRIDALDLPSNKFKVIEKSYHRVYRRGHRAMRKAQRSPQAERFHDWRKRVKYLRFHIEILNPIWPNVMNALGEELNQLSDYLGNHHDLAVLTRQITEGQIVAEPNEGKTPFLQYLADRQQKLVDESFLLGEKLYLERPADFVFGTRQYWELWQQQTKQLRS